MRNFIVRLFVNAVALSAAAYIVDGVELTGTFGAVLVVALVFGLVNALIKPIVLFVSLPALFLTLGLFALVINAGLLLLTARLTESLTVAGFLPALWGSLVVSLVSMLVGGFLKDEKKKG